MIDLWYKNAIVYSLDVETFADGNGDGIGDFKGLTSRLDYLAGLNITCLWLLPFYPSPNRDNGYDITDYYGVDPRHGTLGDFVEFTHQAQERGIRVMVDLVVNHTSIDHPWFQEARRNPDSPYRDWYVWASERPAGYNRGMVFPGVQDSVWSRDEEAGMWYFHRFYWHQPDLNFANPHVREEVAKIMGFWLQVGVSGFRVDAVPFLIENKGVPEPPEFDPHDYLRELRTYLTFRRGDAVMLAEANLPPEAVPNYFGAGDKLQMMFNFLLNQHLFLALALERAEPIRRTWSRLPPIPPVCQWANFLRNHDELDLGRLASEERDGVYARFAPDEDMRLYDRGIRRRLAPMLGGDRQRQELAYSLMLTLPGTPVLRYGDEIGMGEDLSLPERESVRTPMQWSAGPNGGFSTAAPERLVLPVIRDGPFGYERLNVEEQQRDPESLLNWFERALRIRRRSPEFGWGRTTFLETGKPAVLVQRSEHDSGSVVTVHNLSGEPASIEIEFCGAVRDLLAKDSREPGPGGRHRIDLGAYDYHWFREER